MALSGRESSLVQTFFCEFCVQLDITHPSVHMIRRFVIQGCPTLICIVCVLYETISTVLVSDVKQPYQMMLAISTESVPGQLSGVNPPTAMSSL